MEDSLLREIIKVRENADLIITESEIHRAIDQVAENIKAALHEEVPVFLCVMKGGLPFTSELMKRIQSPLELDYVHVDRYRNKTLGSSIHWHKEPNINLKNRLVVIIDDIFDEGYTMQELIAYCEAKGANKVISVVLLKKKLATKHTDYEADFIGLTTEDRYLFGWGMDYKGHWRNLSNIYAVNED